jgi:transcription antitermination factor NusG
MSEDLKEEWYVWTIRPGAFEAVKKYIEVHISGVSQIVRPSVTEEKVTKKGVARKKQTPLYAGYVFLNYYHDHANPTIWVKLNDHPLITSYVGPCSSGEFKAR